MGHLQYEGHWILPHLYFSLMYILHMLLCVCIYIYKRWDKIPTEYSSTVFIMDLGFRYMIQAMDESWKLILDMEVYYFWIRFYKIERNIQFCWPPPLLPLKEGGVGRGVISLSPKVLKPTSQYIVEVPPQTWLGTT